MVDAVLINQPRIDFAMFLGVTLDALGFSPAAASDASRRRLSDAERFLSCLEALTDPKAAPGLRPHLLTHVSFSVLVAVEDCDALAVLESAAGMPFVSTETRVRGVQLLVITGSLAQWRDAVISGTQQSGMIQACYCKIHSLFEAAGLNVWSDCVRKPSQDRLFYLEDRR